MAAGHEVVLPLPVGGGGGSQYDQQRVTGMKEPMLKREGIVVGCTVCTMDAGRVWVIVMNLNQCEVELRLQKWLADIHVRRCRSSVWRPGCVGWRILA